MTTIARPFNPLSEEEWNRVRNSTPEHLRDGPNTYSDYVRGNSQRNLDIFGIDAPDWNKPAQDYQRTFAAMFRDIDAEATLAANAGNLVTADKKEAMATADNAIKNALELAQGYGVAPLVKDRTSKNSGSKTFKALNPSEIEDIDKLPIDKGFVYMTHLYNQAQKKKFERKGYGYKGRDDVFIFTDQPEALKTAISLMGIQSDKNPGGVPIDFNEAMKAYFGNDDKLDDVAKAEWKTQVEHGDSTIDPKRVRKFTNYDGSITWEILNQDKTVANRFTIGTYKGTKVFAQGGYKPFLELMAKARKEFGTDSDQFDWLQRVGKNY